MNEILLKVENLDVSIEKKENLYQNNLNEEKKIILKNFELVLNKNEVHILMGPNGCGKSTFSKVLVGHPNYIVENGRISFLGKDITELSPEKRALEGIFLAFQYPPEISGVSTYDFLRLAYNEKQKHLGLKEFDPIEFFQVVNDSLKKVKLSDNFLSRNLNEGFSGGEKKRNEILQMILLQPKLVILDEIDSGLDIDSLKLICQSLKDNLHNESSLLVITHNPKMIDYLVPNYIHLMINGKISKTGSKEIIEIIEKEGYEILQKFQDSETFSF